MAKYLAGGREGKYLIIKTLIVHISMIIDDGGDTDMDN